MTNDPDEKQPPVPPQPGRRSPGRAVEKCSAAGRYAAKSGEAARSSASRVTDEASGCSAIAARESGCAPEGAAKPAAAVPPKPAAPKPPAAPPPPKEGALPLDNDLVRRYKARFGEGIREAWIDRKQAILVVGRDQYLEIAQYSRDEEQFDYLVDLTAVDWPKREMRFDLVLILYSFAKNERLRLKVHVGREPTRVERR